jgi:hypothetical protein
MDVPEHSGLVYRPVIRTTSESELSNIRIQDSRSIRAATDTGTGQPRLTPAALERSLHDDRSNIA